jgi:uncharacterized protein YjiS (DUF1127 family)
MTCTTCPRPAPAAVRPLRLSIFAGHVGALIRAAWRAYWERRARRATVLLLRSLCPRTLHDIGIAPSEIESLVYGCDADRRRCYDAAWRRRGT